MEQTTSRTVALAIYQAYVDKDRAEAERLVADDFRFTSPLDNGIDRATYFVRCWPNCERIKGFEIKHVVVDDERVIVTYEGTTNEGKGFRNTECLTVRNGRLVGAEVYFGWSLPHEAKPGGFIDKQP